jgi:hypothetical protein
MFLRYFQRGEPITSDKLNAIVDAVRANEVTPGNGYFVNKTPAGTSLSISPGTASGGTTQKSVCPFEVTDASIGTMLKVEVTQGLVAGRWPDGMSLGGPPYILEISQSCYIYCKLQYVPNDVILDSNSDAITFLQSNDLQENTVDEEYVLVATIVVTGTKITNITNVCAQIIPNPCNLKWGA